MKKKYINYKIIKTFNTNKLNSAKTKFFLILDPLPKDASFILYNKFLK